MKTNLLRTLAIVAITLLMSTLSFARPETPTVKTNERHARAATVATTPTISIDGIGYPDNSYQRTFEIQRQEDKSALTPGRQVFHAKKYITISAPNFSDPLRRPPIRRKGRIQG